MPKIEFDPKLSIGNVVTIAMLALSLAGGWFTLVGTMSANAKDIQNVTERVSAIEANITEMVRQLNAEKVDQTRILTQLQTDMSYTREAVDEIRRAAQ